MKKTTFTDLVQAMMDWEECDALTAIYEVADHGSTEDLIEAIDDFGILLTKEDSDRLFPKNTARR